MRQNLILNILFKYNNMSKTYTFEFKKKLKEKIERLTEKKHLEKIRDIIFKYNPDISVSQNSSGMLLFFHNLTDETYNKIENYIDKINKDIIKELTISYANTLSSDINDSEDINIKNIEISNIKLSSLEKNLIKKKDYYDKLEVENNNKEDDDIFLDKDSLTMSMSEKKYVKK